MITALGSFLGGLGLFLLAVSMITDGLKLSVGGALRSILTRSTSTRLRGIASGMLMTGIVQSSSAVTLATIGFVNAGLLNLAQSLGIVYGANIGTTMTGWLVAAMGFEINIEAFALPMIGLGMAARIAGPSRRIGALGEAMAGFGLFFIGVDFLQQAFSHYAGIQNLSALSTTGFWDPVIYVLIGFVMTLVTQSSSAAIALTLTAATGGVLAIDTAAAMVIGANVGTTSTAMFAVIGATPNAKRVAAAHVAFNLITGVVALLILPLMLRGVALTSDALGLSYAPAIVLAIFHTTFNILGVLLVWPLTDRLAAFLQHRFVSYAETIGRPQFLDANVLVTPLLGVDALRLELARMADMARQFAIQSVTNLQLTRQAGEQAAGLLHLTSEVQSYVTRFEQQRLPQELAGRLPLVLRINNYIEETVELARTVHDHADDIAAIAQGRLGEAIGAFQGQAAQALKQCAANSDDFDAQPAVQAYQDLHAAWHDLKSNLLAAASRGDIPVGRLNPALDGLRACLRIVEENSKICRRQLELRDPNPQEAAPD